jgi:hypothetical protein
MVLIPVTQIFGALMAVGIMTGAILSHLFVLGIVVQDDGGTLFILACVVLFSSLGVIFIRREEIVGLIAKAKNLRSANVGT